jgi:hypothetical protein
VQNIYTKKCLSACTAPGMQAIVFAFWANGPQIDDDLLAGSWSLCNTFELCRAFILIKFVSFYCTRHASDYVQILSEWPADRWWSTRGISKSARHFYIVQNIYTETCLSACTAPGMQATMFKFWVSGPRIDDNLLAGYLSPHETSTQCRTFILKELRSAVLHQAQKQSSSHFS